MMRAITGRFWFFILGIVIAFVGMISPEFTKKTLINIISKYV